MNRVGEVIDGTVRQQRDQQLSSSSNGNSSSTSPVKLIAEDGLHVWHMMDVRFLVPKVCPIFVLFMSHPVFTRFHLVSFRLQTGTRITQTLQISQ